MGLLPAVKTHNFTSRARTVRARLIQANRGEQALWVIAHSGRWSWARRQARRSYNSAGVICLMQK